MVIFNNFVNFIGYSIHSVSIYFLKQYFITRINSVFITCTFILYIVLTPTSCFSPSVLSVLPSSILSPIHSFHFFFLVTYPCSVVSNIPLNLISFVCFPYKLHTIPYPLVDFDNKSCLVPRRYIIVIHAYTWSVRAGVQCAKWLLGKLLCQDNKVHNY